MNGIHDIGTRKLRAITALLLLGAIVPAIADPPPGLPAIAGDQKILHVLNRIGYGPRPGDIERVRRMGLDAYIDQQLHPERIDDRVAESKLAHFDLIHMSTADLLAHYPAPGDIARQLGLRPAKAGGDTTGDGETAGDAKAGAAMRDDIRSYYVQNGLKAPRQILNDLQSQKIVRALYSERQLQEVMTDFWLNHFNIFWSKGSDKWLTADFEMNAIRPNTLGKFQDLLMATAKSPAMLFYLDNYLSASPDSKQPGKQALLKKIEKAQANGRVIGPQAEQVKQALKRQPGINENYARELMELHTLGVDGGYTQHDVQEIARCFTGWTIAQPRQQGTFIFRPQMHDNGEKQVLGITIPAGGGIGDGERVIEILAHSPVTARFIATKLVRRFVSDMPPDALVDRVAATYMRTDGDIREMLRTILTSDEFYSPDTYRAKIKSPFELAISAMRALDGATDGSAQLAQNIAKMGEPLYLYQPPTGYPDRASQWVNTGALLDRLNFGMALSANRIGNTNVDLSRVAAGVEEGTPEQILQRATATLLAGDMSPETRAALQKQIAGTPPGTKGNRVAGIFGLVLGTPEFQRR